MDSPSLFPNTATPLSCDLWPRAVDQAALSAPPPPQVTALPSRLAAVADPPPSAVFPSARRAIACSLTEAGLTATSLVGYPAFVSRCVPRAIGQTATPVRVSPEASRGLDGVLVYEAWGWPLARRAVDHLLNAVEPTVLIVDRVESADFFSRALDHPRVVEILSLSKTLGLLGGGLARTCSSYLAFRSAPLNARTAQALQRLASGSASEPYREFFKNSDQALHPAVCRWLQRHAMVAALESERVRRQRNLRVVQASQLAAGWPRWMHDAVAAGAGPGLAPVLRGCPPAAWVVAMRRLAQDFGVASTISVFNWSGDPLEPAYEPCLLIPVHSQMQQVEDVVRALT